MTLSMLPLNTLCLSSLNVRHTERDADIASLAEDIAARGLIQNLVVVPAHFMTGEATEGWDDKWEVIAGGRRFQAMQLLVADGRLAVDHPVACLVEDRDEAREISLSENLHKVSMNPADEFAAYQAIVDNTPDLNRDAAIAKCAKRFGKTVRHVEGRLRLASLCPEVLDALRADLISLDAAKAYAATTDHDLQRKVFAARERDTYSGHNANTIRYEIRGKTLPLDAPLATFVGLVAYQAEGGRIEAEMFMGAEGQQRIVDVPLLKKLATAMGEAAVPALAKADGFKSGLFVAETARMARMPKPPEGFALAWDNCDQPSKTKLKKSIAVYAINAEGTGLERIGRLKPADETKKTEAPRDWEAERAEQNRIRAIEHKASQMAIPKFAGTPLEGIAFYPANGWNRDCDDDHVYVELLIKVSITDIEAQRAEAERLIDEEEAAVRREKLIEVLKTERESAEASEV